jgi:hypothetical protein
MNYLFGKSILMYLVIPLLFYANAFRTDKSVRNRVGFSASSFDVNALFNYLGSFKHQFVV